MKCREATFHHGHLICSHMDLRSKVDTNLALEGPLRRAGTYEAAQRFRGDCTENGARCDRA